MYDYIWSILEPIVQNVNEKSQLDFHFSIDPIHIIGNLRVHSRMSRFGAANAPTNYSNQGLNQKHYSAIYKVITIE